MFCLSISKVELERMLIIVLFGFVFLNCGANGNNDDHPNPTPISSKYSIGYRNLLEIERLDQSRAGYSRLYSSHNQNDSENRDYNHYIGMDPDGAFIMAQYNGPGVITRIWMTARVGAQDSRPGFWRDALFKIYIDGSEIPLISMNPNQFFSGQVFPFKAPFVGQHSDAKGFFSYVPISFSSSVKMTIKNPVQPSPGLYTDEFFYQINVLELNTKDEIQKSPIRQSDGSLELSLEDQEAYQILLGRWNEPLKFANEMDGAPNMVKFYGPLNQIGVLAELKGPGRIDGLRLHTAGISASELGDIRLRIQWDGEEKASIDTPLSVAWASSFRRSEFEGLIQGALSDGTLYLHLPMPYRKSARIELLNETGHELVVGAEIFYGSGFIDENTLYLHADAAEGVVRGQERMKIAQIEGAGHVVGLQLAIEAASDSHILEGDEFIIADERNVYEGTGMEDFFNAHWFFEGGLRSRPLHGTTSTGPRTLPKMSSYRWLVPDSVSFLSTLQFEFENGNPPGNLDKYSSVLFYYMKN